MKKALLLIGACFAHPAIAAAQTAAPTEAQVDPGQAEEATSPGGADALSQDIVVTAMKTGRGENVQSVPIAVTALGKPQLDAKFFQNLKSLSYDVPNVQMEDVGTTPGYANFSIRGLGINSSIPSIDPTTGVFVDGMYLGINAGVVFDNFDLDGVEVLRGPQGLLFGRNVTGGAIVLRTSLPSFTWRGSMKASVETGLKKTVSGVVSGPIVGDVVAAKLAVYRSDDDGWFRNRFDGRSFGKGKSLIVRPAVTIKSGDFRMDLRYEHGEATGQGSATQNHALFARDSFDFSIDYAGFYDNHWDQASVETQVRTGPGDGLLTNLATYRQYVTSFGSDIDGTPRDLFAGFSAIRQEQLSDELRYSARLGDVDLTTGFYYFSQKIRYGELRKLFGGLQIVSGGGQQDQDTEGLFASVDWHFTPALTLNLGGRYTWETKRVAVASLRPGGCDLATVICNANFRDEHSWQGLTPKIGIQWKPSSGTQLYGYYTRGFRSGGYNLRSTDVSVRPGPFDQETQDSFELGLKQRFGRNHVNLAAFANRVGNLQREVNLPGPLGISQVIRNTADADIRGIEAEALVYPVPRLALSAQIGYVHGRYRNVVFDLNSDGAINGLDAQLKLPRLAPLTYGAGITYDLPLGGIGVATARASFNHRDRSAFTDNNRGYLQGADMLDASITLQTGEHLRWSVYARNLLNQVTIGADTPLPAAFGGAGATFSSLNKGRVIGAEISADF